MGRTSLTLALILCFCSCGTHGVSPAEMKAAQDAVESRFNIKNVNITILSDKRLQIAISYVAFIDSTFESKQVMADSIAAVCKHYLDKESLVKGSVIFMAKPGYIANENEKTKSYRVHLD